MTFLFVLQYPGYLRYFDSTIRLLGERGHKVLLSFDSPHKQPEGIEALKDASPNIKVLGKTPGRHDMWAPVGKAVRGTIDYARYLHPRFAAAPYLRNRMRAALPPAAAFLGRRDTMSERATRRIIRAMGLLERAIPSGIALDIWMASVRPDAVIVSPLVTDQSSQVDILKSAKALGIRTALCVASWDHLTTKGLMRIQPDLVALWNEEQKAEALAFHGVPADRIVVTGAQPFDRWFDRGPHLDREAFCRRAGLRADQPIILFVGSTASISAPDAELQFVRRWVPAVRAACGTDVGILIRPHPYNSTHWSNAEVSDLPNTVVYPQHQANPVDEADRADYFDSLYHCTVVVGVNTSAMIEAAIVGRVVHAILEPEFASTQGGTLHFRYLLPENGGFLRVAHDLGEHGRQLADTLSSPDLGREAIEHFVKWFVRPQGLDVASTPIMVAALERLAASGPAPRERVPVHLYPLRFVMWLVAGVVYFRGFNQTQQTIRRAVRLRRRLWKQRWDLWIWRRSQNSTRSRRRFAETWRRRWRRVLGRPVEGTKNPRTPRQKDSH